MRSWNVLTVIFVALVGVFSLTWGVFAAPQDLIKSKSPIPDLQLQVPIGDTDTLPLVQVQEDTLVVTGMATYIRLVYTWLVIATAVIAVLALSYGGVLWIMSRGQSSQTEQAREVISNALIGLLLVLGSYTILWLINPRLVIFQPFSLNRIKEVPIEIHRIDETVEGVNESEKNQIVLHHSGGTDSQSCHKIAGKPACHYWVLTTGRVVKCAEENVVLPCQWGANLTGIGIELSSVTGKSYTQRQLDAAADLVKQIASRHSVPNTTVVSGNLNAKGKKNPGQSGSGGVFNHSNVCALLRTDYGRETRWDPPENIFKMIVEKAGITYTAGQPRCDNGSEQGNVTP